MKLIAALVCIVVSCGSASVQPSNEGACLYELPGPDAGVDAGAFRVRNFTHFNDCVQYQALCNESSVRCTGCCTVCEL